MRGDTTELGRVAAEARAIATEAGQPLTTAHLLLALVTVPTPADLLLRSKRVDEEALLARLGEIPSEDEQTVSGLVERAREVAKGTNATEAKALHLLIAIARGKGTAAYELLGRVGLMQGELAREVLGYVVGPLPRRLVPKDVPQERPVKAVVAFASAPPRALSSSAPSHTSSPPLSRPAVSRSAVSVAEAAPQEIQRQSRISKLRRLAEGLTPEPPPSPYSLNPEEFPWLSSLGRNLSELAALGRIDPVVGREREIDEAMDVLGKRRSNNPVLVGEPGVGKTSVVEGIALEWVRAHEHDASQPPRLIVELDTGALVAGTALRGSLSEKLNGVKEEVRRANGRIVVFIDEIHTLVGAGQTGEGAQDAANELKAALARGEFPCVGATTFAEFQRYFTQDPALERRFVPIRVDEPTVEETLIILRGVAPKYASHHGVAYTDEAIEAAASLSARHVHERHLPDKAITVLDHAGSRARREGLGRVTRTEVARVVARMARVPDERVLATDSERVLKLEEDLARRVVGHRDAVERTARTIRRNFAGFSGRRPLASFIFLGPTGVGKTELAKALAECVFGGEESLVRIDMSELSESHAVSKLIGSPPGYVGHGEGGLLTEAVRRRPASVVLLDEIEKAHRDSQQLVLQMLDEGRLTDGRGRRVDFTSTIVVLTSNLGAEAFAARERTLGFGAAAQDDGSKRAAKALELARAEFPPELWNRIEERIVFAPLQRRDLVGIARLLGADSARRLKEDKRISFELDDGAIEWLLDNGGHDALLGARPLRQAMSRHIEAPLADRILKGIVQEGDRIRVIVRANKLDFEHLTIIEPSLQRSEAP